MTPELADRKFFKELEEGKHFIAPCPGCGHHPERSNLLDSLHPTGRQGEPDVLFEFRCLEIEAGCGDWLAHGRTVQEVISRWNWQAQHPSDPMVVISRMREKSMRRSVAFWTKKSAELRDRLGDQARIADSLKKDYLELYKKLPPEPCAMHSALGGGCSNRLQCWEPCGNLGNDERFVSVAPKQDIPVLNDKIG